MPDTSLVLGFQYKGVLFTLEGRQEVPLASSGITGLQDAFSIFSNSPHIGTVLVYFTETGASRFFRPPLNELFSESVSLDTFLPKSILDNVQEQLSEADTDLQRIAVIERFLLSQLQLTAEDGLVTEALRHIVRSNGTIRITELAKNLHISQSPLEKRFRKLVGATPKKFASIIRLRTVIDTYSPGGDLTGLAYTAGYFDQAHFIKDFKSFTGETPEKFFAARK